MSLNPYTQSIETKLYFVVFILFGSFLTLLVYHASLDTAISADESVSKATTPFQRHLQEVRTATSSNPDSISGWKTYRNEKYGFEVKYPAGWYVWPFAFGANVRIASTPYEDRAHGSGMPSGMWLDFTHLDTVRNDWGDLVKNAPCYDTGGEFFESVDPPSGNVVKIVCYKRIRVEALTSVKSKDEDKKMLDTILSTFKLIQ